MNVPRIVIDTNILVSGLKRAEKGSRTEFMDLMERVPDVPADPHDTR